MGTDIRAYAVVGFVVTKEDFLAPKAPKFKTCEHGHPWRPNLPPASAYCPIDGTRFELRVENEPLQALSALAEWANVAPDDLDDHETWLEEYAYDHEWLHTVDEDILVAGVSLARTNSHRFDCSPDTVLQDRVYEAFEKAEDLRDDLGFGPDRPLKLFVALAISC